MIKKLKDYAFSNERPIEERRFLLTVSVICAAIIAVMVSVITTNQSMVFAVGLAFTALVLVGVVRYTLTTKRYTIGSGITVVIGNMLLLPVGYFLGGGMHSGAPLWFVIGILVVFILFKGAACVVFLILTLLSFATAIFISVIHPELVIGLQEEYSEYLDTFISMSMVAILSGILFQFQSIVLENELNNTESQKGEIEKLSRLQNNFFASMSHEIRTPINTIIGLNEMTMREKTISEEVKENTLNIQNASKILLSLINDILDMSKIQSGKMEITPAQYDSSRMLSEITNLHWNRAIEKGLHFDIQVGDNIPPMLYGDETRIKQVIINLLTNAIKYTEEGSVVMRFGGDITGPDQFLMRVEIEDTGIGIRKENIPYLFDAFQRVNEEDTKNIEGTGLGLSIAKQLTDLMDGTITVNSIYTKGSTFRLEIPQGIVNSGGLEFQKPGVLKIDKPDYQQSFEAPEAKVLVVDDNDMNRIVCRKLLRATRVQVDLAESGAECLEKVSEKHYDVIFMDHEMPQMDGVETLHRVRQQTDSLCRETPVIALTANAGSDKEGFYLEQGFSAYLSKPIQSSQLEALLLACLPEDLVEKSYTEVEENTLQIYEAAHKLPFAVTTDSICDLPDTVLAENDIRVMPYYILTEEGRFKDRAEIDADNLQHYRKSNDYTVRSTPATVEEYENFFGDALVEARMVLHLSSSGAISDAYKNAAKAAESFGNVYVIDTGYISSGLGLLAVHAVEMFRSGIRVEEVIQGLKDYGNRISLNYLVPHITHTETAYRTGFLPRMMMDVFNTEPVFTIKKGRIKIRRFLMGYIRSTSDQFVRSYMSAARNAEKGRVYVTFSGCSPETRKHVLEEIERYDIFDEIIVNKSSAATFCNCGPDAFGIVYLTKNK